VSYCRQIELHLVAAIYRLARTNVAPASPRAPRSFTLSGKVLRSTGCARKNPLPFAIQSKVMVNKQFPVFFGFYVLQQGMELLMIALALDVEMILAGQELG